MSPSRVGSESRFMPVCIQEPFTPGAARRHSRCRARDFIDRDPPQTKRLSERLSKTGLDKVRTCTGNGRSVHARQRHRSSRRQSDLPSAVPWVRLYPASPCVVVGHGAFFQLGCTGLGGIGLKTFRKAVEPKTGVSSPNNCVQCSRGRWLCSRE
jgi:hypothetical protein